MTVALASVRVVEAVRLAVRARATDVHLFADSPPVLRIDGRLEHDGTLPMTCEQVQDAAAFLLGASGIAALARDGDVTAMHRELACPARVHAYRTASGTALALRLLQQEPPDLDELHLPRSIGSLAAHTQGLVLFTGPTGSGKSTALAALLRRINETSHRHVVTIEDPIEFVHHGGSCAINQREVGRDVPGYEEGVYGALRADPDVLLVGEMRRPATIHAALTAAETGHLVLSTLHTSGAAETIERITGVFEAGAQQQVRVQLAQVLKAVVSLRLIARRGAPGRVPAVEILLVNDAVRALVREAKTHQIANVMTTSRQAGMQTFEAHLADLRAAGTI